MAQTHDGGPAQNWQPMATALKDGTRVDLWAKCWRAASDDFMFARHPDCYWTKGDSMTGRNERWVNLGDGWCPVAWILPPSGPTAPPQSPAEHMRAHLDEFGPPTDKRRIAQLEDDRALDAAHKARMDSPWGGR